MVTADNERIVVCKNASSPLLILYTRTIDSYYLKIGKHISDRGGYASVLSILFTVTYQLSFPFLVFFLGSPNNKPRF